MPDFVLFCLCRFFKEALACVLAGILGMPLGVIQFLPVYHPLHDSNNVHTEVCVFLQMSVYVMITWAGDRQAAAKRHELQGKEKEKKKSRLLNNKFLSLVNWHCQPINVYKLF